MPKASAIQTSFNAGEFAPEMEGRVEFAKYANACQVLRNFVPLVEGPAERRPGTHYVAPVKTELNRTWLMGFRFNRTQSYQIELGDRYARFFTNRGVLLSGGVPYEIVSPYTTTMLTGADGTFNLGVAQSNDVMFMANGNVFPQILERQSATNWDFRAFGLPPAGTYTAAQSAFQWPFKSFNVDNGKQVYASASTGAITLQAASGVVFEAWMVNTLMLIESNHGSTVAAWEPGKAVSVGFIRRVDSRVYKCTVGANPTGTVRPTHTEGVRTDGDNGATWQYLHPGYGVAIITAVIDGAHANAIVVMELPSDVVGAPQATSRYQVSAWNSNDGYPTAVGFFRGRLWWIRGTTAWGSVAGDFFNYAERQDGEVLPDSAITLTFGGGSADPVLWAKETDKGLKLGTESKVWMLSEITTQSPLAPDNVDVRPQNAVGARAVPPIQVQEAVLYVQAGGLTLQEAMYSWEFDKIQSRDLTVLAPHATKTGIVAMDFAAVPRSAMWLARADGRLVSFTYNKEQDVYGWHPHDVGGNGAVESVSVIPSPDGTVDDVWLIVRRTINGNTRRYVEYLDRGFRDGDAIVDAWYVDCGLDYRGPPVSTLSGLNHLIGATVDVLANGAAHPQCVVNGSGQITLAYAAARVIVGLPAPCKLATMRRNEGAADGTAQGKIKRIHRCALRFLRTVGGKTGPSETELDEIEFRDSSMLMDTAIPPFTGDKVVMDWPGGYESDCRVWYVNDQPLPATVVALMPQLLTMD